MEGTEGQRIQVTHSKSHTGKGHAANLNTGIDSKSIHFTVSTKHQQEVSPIESLLRKPFIIHM